MHPRQSSPGIGIFLKIGKLILPQHIDMNYEVFLEDDDKDMIRGAFGMDKNDGVLIEIEDTNGESLMSTLT